MEVISWTLNAIDTLFSTRKAGSGEPACPDGTFAAGYTRDSWEAWRVVCLAPLSVEDIEDLYLFGTLITGLLLIGAGIALVYRLVKRTEAAVQSPLKLPAMIEMVGRAVSTQQGTIVDIDRRLDAISGSLTALQGAGIPKRVDHIGVPV